MDVRFIDTTFCDGSQSLWASGIRPGMMEAVAEDMARAGFDVIEVPGGNYMKKCVRDLKQDPWAMARMLAGKMPKVVKSSMAGSYIFALDRLTPRSMIEFYYAHLVRIGYLNRVQVTSKLAGGRGSCRLAVANRFYRRMTGDVLRDNDAPQRPYTSMCGNSHGDRHGRTRIPA